MMQLISQDVYGVLASNTWTATGLKAFPANFQGVASSVPYVLVSILVPYRAQHSHDKQNKTSGMIIFSIFTDNSKGDTALHQICTTIAGIFEDKQLTNGTNTGLGSLVDTGVDKDNKSLYRGNLRIPFTLFGE